MPGVAGTLLTDVKSKLSPPASAFASASLSSLDDGARLALLLVGGARTERGAGVGGTTGLASNLMPLSSPSFPETTKPRYNATHEEC